MFRIYTKFCDYLLKLYTSMGVLLLIVIVIASSLQVFTRYIMEDSLLGTEEVARYCFIWATMLGACICVSKFTHASVNLLNDALKGKAKKIHSIIIDAVVFIAAAILIIEGINIVMSTTSQYSSGLGIPIWVVYLSMPVSGFGMAALSLERIFKKLLKKGETQ